MPDFNLITPEGYVFLALSLVGAIFLDWAVVKFGLDFLRPASAYVFLIGRAGKLVSFIAWFLFVSSYWYPHYLSQDQPIPGLYTAVGWGLVALMAILAFTTLPRMPQTIPAPKKGPHV